MKRRGLQFSLTALLGIMACVALNLWLFRLGTLIGLIGLNVSKHLIVAWVCQGVGVDRKVPPPAEPANSSCPPGLPIA